MGTPKVTSRRGSKRILKPVIEKKRRDRINQRLDELRTLLLDNTLDSRLLNPKLEKAEILELTVEYIRKKTNGRKEKREPSDSTATAAQQDSGPQPCVSFISLQDPGSIQTPLPNNPLYVAGFRECISRLAGFIDCVEPCHRDSFIQGLRQHLDAHSGALPQGRVTNPPGPTPWMPSPELQCRTDMSAVGPVRGKTEALSYSNALYPSSFILPHPHASAQPPISHPYPSPPYSLSPPPSPCYSASSPPFSASPPYITMPCQFLFPPSLSPPSSDSSSSSASSLSTPAAALVCGAPSLLSSGPPTPLRPLTGPVPPGPARTLRRTLFQNQAQTVWRPW
ncbi:hairy-related 1 [Chanos chanos]|uniref:Hairy-related 1 n=1 Tax=Chanos chanos TaxID=29144 RepID=A0A6J2WVF3_CHACN|nr:transcription factor HES-7-like [Chanos chanos]